MRLDHVGADKASRTVSFDGGRLPDQVSIWDFDLVRVDMIPNVASQLLQVELLLQPTLDVSLVSSDIEVLVLNLLVHIRLHQLDKS